MSTNSTSVSKMNPTRSSRLRNKTSLPYSEAQPLQTPATRSLVNVTTHEKCAFNQFRFPPNQPADRPRLLWDPYTREQTEAQFHYPCVRLQRSRQHRRGCHKL